MNTEVTTSTALVHETPKAMDELAENLFGKYSNIDYKKVELLLQNYEYAVALDIGGGNCSGAYMPIKSFSDPHIKTALLDNIQSLAKWSCIGYTSSQKKTAVKIGRTAVRSLYTYDGYKCVPTANNLAKAIRPYSGEKEAERSVKDLTEDFIEVLLTGIIENNEDLKKVGRDKILFMVGHPSDKRWLGEKTQHNLMNIVRNAAGLSAENLVLTMSESNAAILYATDRVRSVAGTNNVLKGRRIIIIDLGAFSADITYIDRTNGAMKQAQISTELGAKSVDKNIAAIALAKTGHRVTDDSVYQLSYTSRQIKEERWSGTDTTHPISIDGMNYDLTNEDIDSAVKEYKFTLDNIEDSYTGHLERFIDRANDEIFGSVNDRPRAANEYLNVDCVYVVGGAARMIPAFDVIKAKASSLWGVPANSIWPKEIQDVIMNEAVPHGMLRYFSNALVVLTKTPELITKLEKYIEDNFPKKIAGRLMAFTKKTNTPATMIEYLWNEIILPQMKIWSMSENDLSGDDLNTRILEKMNTQMHKTEIERLINKGVTEAITELQSGLSDILKGFIEKLYNIDPNQAEDYKGGLTNVEIQNLKDSVVAVISSKIVENIENRYDGIFMAIFGWLLPFVCFGVLIYVARELVGDKFEAYRVNKMSLAEQKEYWKKKEEDAKKREEAREEEAENRRKEENAKKRKKREREYAYRDIQKEEKRQEVYDKLDKCIKDTIKEILDKDPDKFGIPAAYLSAYTTTVANAVYVG